MQAETGGEDEEGRKGLALWRLVETIIDSKPFYAKHQDQLKTQLLIFTQAQAKVDFASAGNWLFGEEKKEEGNEGSGKGQEFTSEERFAMFVLFDFVCRLFQQEQMHDEAYMELKNRIVREYISDETIEGKIAGKKKELDFGKLEKESGNKYKFKSWAILINFMQKGSFLFNLYLVKYLGRETIYQIFEKEKGNTESQKNLYKIAYSLEQAAKAIGGTSDRKEYLVSQYQYIQEGLEQLLDGLPLSPKVIYGEQLLGHRQGVMSGYRRLDRVGESGSQSGQWFNVIENELADSKTGFLAMKQWHLANAAYLNDMYVYWLYYENCWAEQKKRYHGIGEMLKKLCARGVIKTILDQMDPVIDKYRIKKIDEGGYGVQEGNSKEQAVIQLLDQHKLWEKEYAKGTVCRYLKNKVDDVISQMSKGRLVFDASALKEGAYGNLMKCEEGSSGRALICSFKRELRKIMELSYSHAFMDGGYYMRLEHVLVVQCMLEDFFESHPRVQFWKKEVWQLLLAMRELPLVCYSSGWEKIQQELKEREEKFFKEYENQLKDEKMKEAEENGEFDKIKEYLQNEYYRKSPTSPIKKLLADYKGKGDYRGECNYLMYSVQKDEIEKQQKELELSEDGWKQIWQKREQESLNAEGRFYIHSYLRFLQETGSDMAKAGARADDIAALVKDIIESEIIADKRIQNEIYDLLSKEIGLTEEEFEGLFS